LGSACGFFVFVAVRLVDFVAFAVVAAGFVVVRDVLATGVGVGVVAAGSGKVIVGGGTSCAGGGAGVAATALVDATVGRGAELDAQATEERPRRPAARRTSERMKARLARIGPTREPSKSAETHIGAARTGRPRVASQTTARTGRPRGSRRQ